MNVFIVLILLDDHDDYDGMTRDEAKDDIFKKAKSILRGGIKYFNHTIVDKLAADLEVFKTCRFANPIYIQTLRKNFRVR